MNEHLRYQESGSKLKAIQKIFRIFGPHLRKYWKSFLIAYAALVGTVLINLLKPWPLKLIVDYILLDEPMPEEVTSIAHYISTNALVLLNILCIGIVVVVFLHSIFTYIRRYFMASAGQRTINDIRKRVFDHLHILPQSFHGSKRSGDLIVRLTSDIKELKNLLIKSVEDIVTYVLTFASIVVIMLWMDWQLTLIALSVVPSLYLISVRVSGKVETLTKTQRTKESEVASIVQESMTTMPVVQAYTEEKQEKKRFSKVSQESLIASLNKLKLARAFGRAVDILVAIGTALVVWYGARRVLGGEVTPGDLIVFSAYLKDLYGPINKSSELIIGFVSSLVSGQRIAEILDTDITVEDRPDAIEAPPFRGRVAFSGVSFGYKPGEPVLRELTFSVKPGQMIALVGFSGTGKSTVANLLLRFFDPMNGRILIDGHDIRRFKLKSLRRQISVVFQESLLFRRTIRENIAYGNLQAKEEDIIVAAKSAQAHEFIRKLPNGYETILNERGGNLSGGQRQRLALARAILKDAPILILDEPVTGVDAVTEAQIHKTLNRIMQRKTTFMIAHRLSTIKKADLILVIEEGKVVEQGTHAQLLTNSNRYRELYNLQTSSTETTEASQGGIA